MQNINDYIRKNKLKMKKDGVKPKFCCDFCGMVLCNAKVTICGCRFCTSCIEPFMKESNNCPKCETVLDWTHDMGDGFDLEVKIRNLMITCPNIFCHTKLSVMDMSDHINVCPNSGSKCILNSIGCSDSFKSDSDLNSHLNDEISKHLHLIVNHLESQKICNLEKEINEIKVENTDLKQKLNAEMEEINGIKVENTDLKQKLNAEMEEINAHKVESIEEINGIKVENADLKQKLNAQMEVIEISKIIIDNWKLEFDEMKATIENSKSDLVSVKSDLSKTMKRQSELDLWPELSESYSKIKIENISTKNIATDIYGRIVHFSDKFSVNDYNFMIEFNRHNSGDIEFFVKLIKGEKDEELKWPFEKTLKLMLFDDRGIIIENASFNSTFSYASVSQTSKVYFHKPKSQNKSIPESCIKVFGRNVIQNDSVSLLLIMKN